MAWRALRATTLLLAALALCGAGWPPDGKTLAERGDGARLPSCASCHGAHFQGNTPTGAPALAGKDAAALMDELYTLASNPKDQAPMARIARRLDMAERAAVTAWLSRLPPAR
ncbi:MAG: c-type cytochrome [Acetobacteraceae bacterium]